MAATAAVPLVVEEPAAHVHQGVGAALGRAAAGFAVDVVGLGEGNDVGFMSPIDAGRRHTPVTPEPSPGP